MPNDRNSDAPGHGVALFRIRPDIIVPPSPVGDPPLPPISEPGFPPFATPEPGTRVPRIKIPQAPNPNDRPQTKEEELIGRVIGEEVAKIAKEGKFIIWDKYQQGKLLCGIGGVSVAWTWRTEKQDRFSIKKYENTTGEDITSWIETIGGALDAFSVAPSLSRSSFTGPVTPVWRQVVLSVFECTRGVLFLEITVVTAPRGPPCPPPYRFTREIPVAKTPFQCAKDPYRTVKIPYLYGRPEGAPQNSEGAYPGESSVAVAAIRARDPGMKWK